MGAKTKSTMTGLALLMLMVIQNSSTVLVGKYTRSAPTDALYDVSHMVITSEFLKLFLSCLLEQLHSQGNLIRSFKTHILERPIDALKVSIPALLYLIQNSLIYIALTYVSAPLFQVAYQSKLVTTALLSSIMLSRTYNKRQWLSIITLTIGVAIVVTLGEEDEVISNESVSHSNESTFFGLVLIAVSCLCSSLAGVYFEKVIKMQNATSNASVWMRNIQLSFFTLILASIQEISHFVLAANDSTSGQLEVQKGFFFGFTPWVFLQVFLLSGGGLLVAAVIKYTDSVQKGLATGVSVIVSSAMSTLFFNTVLTFSFLIGTTLIILGVFFFSNDFKTCQGSSHSDEEQSTRKKSEKRALNKFIVLLFFVFYMTISINLLYLLTSQGELGDSRQFMMSSKQSFLRKESAVSKKEDIYSVKSRLLENDKQFPFTFSACLLVKDDNQLLPEWLAYHYTTMPLRRLIVGVDPLSLTRAEPIFDKYRELGMEIDVWSDNSYIWKGARHMQNIDNFDPKNHTEQERFDFYLWRGITFWTTCVRKLATENRTWVGVIDTDEYYAFNQHWDSVNATKIPKYMGKQNETVAHWISSGSDPSFSREIACFKTARVHFAANDTDPETVKEDLPDGFNAKYFHTINHRQHQTEEDLDKVGKVILNTRYYTWQRFVNPHNPFHVCEPKGANVPNKYSSVHTHHYTGTLETFMHRVGDNFRDLQTFQKRNNFWWGLNEYDDSMKPWLKEFVKLVGRDNAFKLTQFHREQAYTIDTDLKNRIEKGEEVEAAYEWK